MKIFLLDRTDGRSDWCFHRSMVVTARDETHAREVAGGAVSGDTRWSVEKEQAVWLSPDGSTCEEVDSETAQVVMTDYYDG